MTLSTTLESSDWWISVVVVGIVVGIIGSLAAAFLKDGLDGWIKSLIARALSGKFASDREICGIWETQLEYPRDGTIRKDDPTLRLWKFGASVFGKGTSSVDKANYRIHGRLSEEGFLTGHWFERTKGGRHYYGAFQLFLNTTNDELRGKWVGLSTDATVKSGDWAWKKTATGSKQKGS